MARGVHLPPVRMKRNEDEREARQHAHVDVATGLNFALNGKSNFGNDISKRDVSKMIDFILTEKKGILGPGGYVERSKFPRITRGLKRAFERHSKLDYDGSESEWKLWRKEAEAEKRQMKELGAAAKGVEHEDRNGREGGTGGDLHYVEPARRRLTVEEMRQDSLSGGYDRTPRRGMPQAHHAHRTKAANWHLVEQPTTTDPDANVWALADIAATNSQSITQWGRAITPPYIPPPRPYTTADLNEAGDRYPDFLSRANHSTISSGRQLQHHPSLPAKPQVCFSSTPSLTYASSSPEKAPSNAMHSLPSKPVSILKSTKNRTNDQFNSHGYSAERFARLENASGEPEEEREEGVYGGIEKEDTGANTEMMPFNRLERAAKDMEIGGDGYPAEF